MDQAKAATSRRIARIGRALLPVLIISAIVALMIVSGIARSRDRLQASRGRFDEASDILRGFCQGAAGFLASRQAADGSWSDAAGTMRILLNVRGTGYEGERFYQAGLDFVRARHRRARAWLRGDAGEEAVGAEPSLETLALAWLLLGAEREPPAEIRAVLQRQETPRGLYRHELSRSGGPPPGARVLLTDNVLVLGILPALDMEAAALTASLRSRMAEAKPLSPRARIALAHLAAVAAESGSRPARSLRTRILGSLDPASLEPFSQLDSASLAAYVRVRSDECLLDADPCNDLNAAVAALATRRQADGSWAADPAGSAAETTSLALRAIATYRRIVDGRSDGTLGGPSPGAEPRRR